MHRLKAEKLREFVKAVMKRMGCDDEKAIAIADVLVEADMRGIHSHGVARLRRYVNHMKEGIIDPRAEPKVVFDTPITSLIDGNNGPGQYVSIFSMKRAIEKAKASGVGLVSVRNSNHFGIAGYYTEMAVKEGLVGITMTNSAPLAVHTFSKEAVLGTNPVSIGFARKNAYPFLLDMALSVVPRGKLEVHARLEKEIPHGWAVDETGKGTKDPKKVLENLKEKKGGGLLPLGGEGETFGGHKGYGLMVLVELFTAGLSLGSFSFETYAGKGRISHFFAAMDPRIFGIERNFANHMEKLLKRLVESKKRMDAERIYLHGEKEYEMREKAMKDGVELDDPTFDDLRKLSEEMELEFP